MARIPTVADLSGAGSLQSGRPIATVDTTAVGKGLEQAGQGVQNLGFQLGRVVGQYKQQENLADGTVADAGFNKALGDLHRTITNDGDYATQTQRFDKAVPDLIKQYGGSIRDPHARSIWEADANKASVGVRNAVATSADNGVRAGNVVKFDTGLDTYRNTIADPTVSDAERDRAKANALAAIDMGEKSGQFTPAEAQQRRQVYIDGADFSLADARIKTHAGNQAVLPPVGGGSPDAVFGRMLHVEDQSGDPAALSQKGAAGLAQLMPGTARETAQKIGINLPDGGDDKKLAAYFATPAGQLANVAIGKAYFTDMLHRYNGDTAAAVIAYNGGPLRADRWLQAGRDDSVLPAETKDYKAKVLGAGGDQTGAVPAHVRANYATVNNMGDPLSPGWKQSNIVPIQAAGQTLEVNKAAAPAFQGFLQDLAATGYKINTAAGYNYRNIRGSSTISQHSFGNAIDINAGANPQGGNASDLPPNIAEIAAKHGLVWGGSWKGSTRDPMHFEWAGPNGTGGDGVTAAPRDDYATAYTNIRHQYPNLTPNQVDALASGAITARNGFAVETRANIEQANTDAPAAIQNTGQYSGTMPTAEDFTQAYGAEAAKKYAAFQANIETSKAVFDQKTLPNADLQEVLNRQPPQITGEGAGLAEAKFRALQEGAAQTLKARAADPVRYTMQAFPSVVGQAWQDVTDHPGDASVYASAISKTIAAQDQLGIPTQNRTYLPGNVAQAVTTAFKDQNLPAQQRVGAVVQAVLTTQDPNQQRSVFQQLVKEGLPPESEGAIEAFARGDTGAGNTLMSAIMADPKGLPQVKGITPEAIKNEIVTNYSDVLNAAYGVELGRPENLGRLQNGSELAVRAVQMRMAQGASDIPTAVKATVQDMFGKGYQVMSRTPGGLGASIFVPAGQDPVAIGRSLDGAQEQVLSGIMDSAKAHNEQAFAGKPGALAVAQADATNQARNIFNNGKWVNLNGGYAFVDPYTNLVVPGKDGKPLIVMANATPTAPTPPAPVAGQPAAVPVAPAAAPATRWDGMPVDTPSPFTPGNDPTQQMQDIRKASPADVPALGVLGAGAQ